jgi:DNA-directed RNA polymerase I subunit RPA12
MSKRLNEFCPKCGSVLPMPKSTDTRSDIECRICNYRMDAQEFTGIVSTVRITFNSRDSVVKKSTRNDTSPQGPIIDRKCFKCGHDKHTYATLQTRGADEGQTIFYTCVNCGAQQHENS